MTLESAIGYLLLKGWRVEQQGEEIIMFPPGSSKIFVRHPNELPAYVQMLQDTEDK